MSKMTLLQVTQSILNVIDGDYVTSISETEEAEQIAALSRDVYHELMTTSNWPHLSVIRQLTGLGDTSAPTKMKVPSDLTDISCIRFEYVQNSKTRFKELTYLPPDSFMDLVLSRDEGQANVTRYLENLVPILIQTDKVPDYYTSFDDQYIICDSFDSSVWDTLPSTATIVEGRKQTVWVMSDDFIPDLPESSFPMYLAEVREAANTYIRQQPTAYDNKISRRSLNRQRHIGSRLDGLNTINIHPKINKNNIR